MPRRSYQDSINSYELAKQAGEPPTLEGIRNLVELAATAHRERQTHQASKALEAVDLALNAYRRHQAESIRQAFEAIHVAALGQKPPRG